MPAVKPGKNLSTQPLRSSVELVEAYLSRNSLATPEAIDLKDPPPYWLVAEALLDEVSKHPGFFAWFCGLLITRNEKRLASAAHSVSWFTRLGAALHEKTKAGALNRLTGDSNRYIRFVAKARLSDTDWVFPPAQSGGQGERI